VTSGSLTGLSSSGSFNTWCVDIYHWEIGGTVTYNVDTTGSVLASALNTLRPSNGTAADPTGATRVQELVELADEQYKGVATGLTSAAFQLAVWEITYGTANASGVFQINTTSPSFLVDAGTLSGADNGQTATTSDGYLANQWLAELGAAPNTANYQLVYLYGGNPTTQSMVVFTQVPEPATLALFVIGLFGIAYSRRRNIGSSTVLIIPGKQAS
jgi:hypothetical protein